MAISIRVFWLTMAHCAVALAVWVLHAKATCVWAVSLSMRRCCSAPWVRASGHRVACSKLPRFVCWHIGWDCLQRREVRTVAVKVELCSFA